MKIVHIIEGLDDSYGGPAKSVPYLAHYCSLAGADPLLLSTRYAGDDCNEVISQKGLPWELFDVQGIAKMRYAPSLRERLLELAKEDKGATIFHVHNLWNYPCYIAHKVCESYGLPLVVSPRGSLFAWSLAQGRFRKRISWEVFQRRSLNSAVVHVTSDDEAHAVKSLGVTSRITQIRNGVELSSTSNQVIARSDAVSALGLDQERHYALFMSRLHKKKGLELLLDAWSGSRRQDTVNWTLLIAGDSSDESYIASLRSKADALGLGDSVEFLGFADADKKTLLFAASHFFVLPSYTENFGIVVAEALAAGLPVITTVGTPWSEIAEEGAGWYIDIDRQALGDAMSEAMRLSPRDMLAMGVRGRRIAARYDWNDIGKEMYDFYQEVLSDQGRSDGRMRIS